jgi:hypothetical protein
LRPETPLKERDAALLSRKTQHVLRAAGVPLDDRDAKALEPPCERHPSHGEHPHRAKRQREKRNLPSKEFTVALSQVRPRPVLDRATPPGKGERSVDHHERRVRVPDEFEDLAIRMHHARAETVRSGDCADPGLPLRGPGEVDADNARGHRRGSLRRNGGAKE